jgi:hypothetical protein
MPPRRGPAAWGLRGDRCVARRRRCHRIASSSRLAPERPMRATPPNSRTGSYKQNPYQSRIPVYRRSESVSIERPAANCKIISRLFLANCVIFSMNELAISRRIGPSRRNLLLLRYNAGIPTAMRSQALMRMSFRISLHSATKLQCIQPADRTVRLMGKLSWD